MLSGSRAIGRGMRIRTISSGSAESGATCHPAASGCPDTGARRGGNTNGHPATGRTQRRKKSTTCRSRRAVSNPDLTSRHLPTTTPGFRALGSGVTAATRGAADIGTNVGLTGATSRLITAGPIAAMFMWTVTGITLWPAVVWCSRRFTSVEAITHVRGFVTHRRWLSASPFSPTTFSSGRTTDIITSATTMRRAITIQDIMPRIPTTPAAAAVIRSTAISLGKIVMTALGSNAAGRSSSSVAIMRTLGRHAPGPLWDNSRTPSGHVDEILTWQNPLTASHPIVERVGRASGLSTSRTANASSRSARM